jgi:hypothetical protein
MIRYSEKPVVQKVVEIIVCDICKKEFDAAKDIIDVQEFTHIRFTGGYGSVFGDGTEVACDVCQHCLEEKLGPAFLKFT